MNPCVLGIVGPSGTGKTTLLTRVIPHLRSAGLRVAALKHSHHAIELDQPGKDSHRLRQAGAEIALLAHPSGWTMMVDGHTEFATMVAALHALPIDLILVEGLREAAIPRLEVFRAALGHPPRYPQDPSIIAIAAQQLPGSVAIPVLDLDDAAAVAGFILDFYTAHCQGRF